MFSFYLSGGIDIIMQFVTIGYIFNRINVKLKYINCQSSIDKQIEGLWQFIEAIF